MNDTATTRRDRWLPIVGTVMIGVGVIGAFVAKYAADQDALVDQYSASVDEPPLDFTPAPDRSSDVSSRSRNFGPPPARSRAAS